MPTNRLIPQHSTRLDSSHRKSSLVLFYRFVDYQQNSDLRKSCPNDRQRTQEQTQLHTVPATLVSAPRCARLCTQMRSSLLPATVVSAPACADSRYWREAKHCSSLCSQSEGDEYCGGQARDENPTRSWPGTLVMFAICSWPSLCEQSELQCWRRNRGGRILGRPSTG